MQFGAHGDALPERRRWRDRTLSDEKGALMPPDAHALRAVAMLAGRESEPVICAVDDDELAPEVVATAALLADRLNAPLTVVHSPHPDVFLTGEPRRVALERGDALVDRLTERYRVDGRVVENDEPGRLITALAREGASMIVLGTRGRTGLRAAMLGSVSQDVMACAPCPVVTVSPVASSEVAGADGAGDGESLSVGALA
jgi:nucleotide-binding universal stress UspA family protein